MPSKATRSGTTKKPESARKRESSKTADTSIVSPAKTALLIVFDVSAELEDPWFAAEYGVDGQPTEYYHETLQAFVDEAWSGIGDDIEPHMLSMRLALEGRMNYPTPGIPTGDTGVIRRRLRKTLREVLIQQKTSTDVIRASGQDFQLHVCIGAQDLVARFAQVWKNGVVSGSPTGIWNQPLVPDSRIEEESEMRKRPTGGEAAAAAPASAKEVVQRVGALKRQLSTVQQPIQEDLQRLLDNLAGQSFGSLKANEQVANELRFLMQELGVRVQCPRPDCREPALIRSRAAGGARHGTFAFEHRLKGRLMTHTSSVTLPPLKLVAAPPDRRRKRRKSKR